MNGHDADNRTARILALIVGLKNIICDAYDDQEPAFDELVGSAGFNYAQLAKGRTFPERALSTVRWFNSDGELDGVLRLAVAVEHDKKNRKDIKRFVVDLCQRSGTPPRRPG